MLQVFCLWGRGWQEGSSGNNPSAEKERTGRRQPEGREAGTAFRQSNRTSKGLVYTANYKPCKDLGGELERQEHGRTQEPY